MESISFIPNKEARLSINDTFIDALKTQKNAEVLYKSRLVQLSYTTLFELVANHSLNKNSIDLYLNGQEECLKYLSFIYNEKMYDFMIANYNIHKEKLMILAITNNNLQLALKIGIITKNIFLLSCKYCLGYSTYCMDYMTETELQAGIIIANKYHVIHPFKYNDYTTFGVELLLSFIHDNNIFSYKDLCNTNLYNMNVYFAHILNPDQKELFIHTFTHVIKNKERFPIKISDIVGAFLRVGSELSPEEFNYVNMTLHKLGYRIYTQERELKQMFSVCRLDLIEKIAQNTKNFDKLLNLFIVILTIQKYAKIEMVWKYLSQYNKNKEVLIKVLPIVKNQYITEWIFNVVSINRIDYLDIFNVIINLPISANFVSKFSINRKVLWDLIKDHINNNNVQCLHYANVNPSELRAIYTRLLENHQYIAAQYIVTKY